MANVAGLCWRACNREASALYSTFATQAPPSSLSCDTKSPLSKTWSHRPSHLVRDIACYMYAPDSVTVFCCHAVLTPYISHHMLTPPQCHITAERAAADRKCLGHCNTILLVPLCAGRHEKNRRTPPRAAAFQTGRVQNHPPTHPTAPAQCLLHAWCTSASMPISQHGSTSLTSNSYGY
jgi:hypothetical protein